MLNTKQSISIIIITFVIFLTVVIGMSVAFNDIQKKAEEKLNNLYPLSTIVEEVHEANNLVTVRDFNGNLWQFYLEESGEVWEKGDICSIIFDSKGTQEIKDDEIITVRYSGFIK